MPIRQTWRALLKHPAFFLGTSITIALGIGAATTMFSVTESQLWRPLAFPESERLVELTAQNQKRSWELSGVSAADFADWRQRVRSLESIGALEWPQPRNLSAAKHTERPHVAAISAGFLETLRVPAQTGRTFSKAEEQPGKGKVALLGASLAQRVFGSSAKALGQVIKLDEEPYNVIGVLPTSFNLQTMTTPDVFTPLAVQTNTPRNVRSLEVIGRLRPASSPEQAEAEMQSLAGALAREYPATNESWGVRVRNLRVASTAYYRIALFVYLGFACFVLLIACLNSAGLQLVRTASRRKDFAIREALGASTAVLLRLTLADSIAIALAGATGGVLLSLWGVSIMRSLSLGEASPRAGEISLDPWALAFALVAALVSVFFCGLFPGFSHKRASVEADLRNAQKTVSAGRETQRRINTFVIVEVTLAFVAVFGAGLFVSSYWQLQHISLGFEPQDILTVRVPLAQRTSENQARRTSLYEQLLPDLRAIPGVTDAVLTNSVPLGSLFDLTYARTDRQQPRAGDEQTALSRVVTPGYFNLLKIPVLRGRLLTDRDTRGAPAVAMVNENLARHIFAGEDPLGKELRLFEDRSGGAHPRAVRIVGLVRNTHDVGLNEVPFDNLYLPFAQNQPRTVFVLAKVLPASNAGPAVRRYVQQLDAGQFVDFPRSLSSYAEEALRGTQGKLALVAAFAFVCVVLAAIGLYSAVSFAVTSRLSEFSLRMALGATTGRIIELTLRYTLRLGLAGVIGGVFLSYILGESFRSALYLAPRQHNGILYGVGIHDPLNLAAAMGLLFLLGLLAACAPAWRASRVDPCSILRTN